MIEIPTTKFPAYRQAGKLQINSNDRIIKLVFLIGIWILVIIWLLVLGYWRLN